MRSAGPIRTTSRRLIIRRTVNPNRSMLAATLAALEGAAGGAITSSGQAAALLALLRLPTGARVVAPHDCYGGTWRLLDAMERQGKIRLHVRRPVRRSSIRGGNCPRLLAALDRDSKQSAAARDGHRAARRRGEGARRADGRRQHPPLALPPASRSILAAISSFTRRPRSSTATPTCSAVRCWRRTRAWLRS